MEYPGRANPIEYASSAAPPPPLLHLTWKHLGTHAPTPCVVKHRLYIILTVQIVLRTPKQILFRQSLTGFRSTRRDLSCASPSTCYATRRTPIHSTWWSLKGIDSRI